MPCVISVACLEQMLRILVKKWQGRTYLYGPAVCCKPDVSDGGVGLALMYPARE